MPNIDENLAFVPSHELAALIADKQVSPVEVAQMYFDRIDRLDSQLNSYLTLTPGRRWKPRARQKTP